MKIVYNDLINFFSKKPTKELLSKKLFQLGHEHDIDGDIYDLDLTPNRGDCLSLLGLARDLNIFFELVEPYELFKEEIEKLDLDFENLSPDECPCISFLEIEIDGEIAEYKPYLENFFTILKNNKVNFFTDVSNYISYELGQPTHCFDRKKIKNKLIFENRDCSESFKTLMDSEIKLHGQNCIFSMGDEIISLAGVMGGESTACSPDTKSALVECAYFIPKAIIGKSLKYNLSSDAAHKFERGVDANGQIEVLRRFIKVVEDHVKIKSVKIQTFSEGSFKLKNLPFETSKINEILGTNLKDSEYKNILEKFGFFVKDQIIVPSYRSDISCQNDLSEEVARAIGYDNIDSKPINLESKKIQQITKINKIENFLVSHGFFEVINFPFSPQEASNSICIDNPLDSKKEYLRTSLEFSLIENLLYNERRQKESIKLFEISDLYSKDLEIRQEKKLGIIISGRVGNNYLDFSKKLDDKYLNQLLNFKNSSFIISEISRNGLKTKKKDKIFYTEILIDDIPDEFTDTIKSEPAPIRFFNYKPTSQFPSSARDFSFSITDTNNYQEVLDHLNDLKHENLKHSFIFDFFENKKNNEIKIGVRLVFQSTLKTLSDNEIEKSIVDLLKPLTRLKGVKIPGLNLE